LQGLKDVVKTFHEVEIAARDEVLANGGSISHHHGVGKIRKRWVTETLSPVGVDMLRGVKHKIDPDNIFGNGNIFDA
jgi:alkyldihydroxyacetonephosphate synthase